jgi:membrane-associated phospholipid phosphatase
MYNIISFSVVPLTFVPIGLYFFTWNTRYIVMFLLALGVMYSADILKKGFSWLSDDPLLKRPKGARDCSSFNRGGLVEYTPGFPSGHSALATYLALSLFWNSNKFFTLSYIAAVGYSRMVKKCHNLIQVIGGICLGFIGYIAYRNTT